MTGFAQPWLLAIAGAGIVGITLLHLISWRRPESQVLPTARFLPPSVPRARWRTLRPSDLLAWALRVSALGALGMAAAGPLTAWGRGGRARVLVVDASRAVASTAEVRDSVGRLIPSGVRTVVVRFDSLARVVPAESIGVQRQVVGHLAAGLAAGVREATALAARAATVDLVVVSPLVQEEWSPALAPIAASWPGELRLVRVRAASATTTPSGDAILPPADDPVGAALRLVPAVRGVVVRRDSPGPADSLHARGGGVLVSWPRLPPDTTVRGLVAGQRTIVAPLARRPVAAGEVLWRWDDGAPAATERPLGEGCIREVGAGLPSVGDQAIRPASVAMVGTLLAPCGRPRLGPAADTTWIHPATGAAPALPTPNVRLQWALYALALVLCLAEWSTRRGVPRVAEALPRMGREQRAA